MARQADTEPEDVSQDDLDDAWRVEREQGDRVAELEGLLAGERARAEQAERQLYVAATGRDQAYKREDRWMERLAAAESVCRDLREALEAAIEHIGAGVTGSGEEAWDHVADAEDVLRAALAASQEKPDAPR